jgi:serine protease Do
MRNSGLWIVVGALGVLSALAGAPAAKQDGRRTPVVEVFERCRDAVVNISTTRVVRMQALGQGWLWDDIFDFGRPAITNRRVQSVGSGVVVHESGYVVTNAHVVSQASDVRVTFADKHTVPAEVVAVDPEHDLAVLKVKTTEPLPYQKLARGGDVLVGETVIAIGNPLGLQHTVTAGIVSALNRDLEFSDRVTYRGLIQTDAPINPGNSGGPLLNVNGELIGINTAIRGDAQNIGFAIPVERLWELLPALLDIERRQRVRFGLHVSGQEAEVLEVREESPAEKAGIRKGDRILEFNGQRLRDGIDYHAHLLSQPPDTPVRLKVRRGDKVLSVTVKLESIPLPDGAKLARELLGLELVEISADLRRRYDLPEYAGLMVERVMRGGPADRVGIIASDLILRLHRTPVTSLKDVGLVLEQTQPNDPVVVEGLRIDADRPFFWTGTLRARGRK